MARGWTNPDLTARPDTPMHGSASADPDFGVHGQPVPAEPSGVLSSQVDRALAVREPD
jgi:hypothetical protein